MVSAYVDHNTSDASLFTGLIDELIELYELPEQYVPGMVIQTSDTGFSAKRLGHTGSHLDASLLIVMNTST